jgi:hypothetical protein
MADVDVEAIIVDEAMVWVVANLVADTVGTDRQYQRSS